MAFSIGCKSMRPVPANYFNTILTSLSGLPFSAVIVFTFKLHALFPRTVLLPHSTLILPWLKRKRRFLMLLMFDDSLMTTLPPITPTVRLLQCQTSCLLLLSFFEVDLPPCFFLSHLELFIAHLTLYLI